MFYINGCSVVGVGRPSEYVAYYCHIHLTSAMCSATVVYLKKPVGIITLHLVHPPRCLHHIRLNPRQQLFPPPPLSLSSRPHQQHTLQHHTSVVGRPTVAAATPNQLLPQSTTKPDGARKRNAQLVVCVGTGCPPYPPSPQSLSYQCTPWTVRQSWRQLPFGTGRRLRRRLRLPWLRRRRP